MQDLCCLYVEEQPGIFLITVAHKWKYRVVQNQFQNLGETISKYFNSTLNSILSLTKHYDRKPDGKCQYENASNPSFYPYFKVNYLTKL